MGVPMSLCCCDDTISENYDIKATTWWMLSDDHSSLVNECVLQYGAWEEADAATAERLATGSHSNHVQPISNSRSLIPTKTLLLLWCRRPLNLTPGRHKASLALIWVRRNMLFLTTKHAQQNACLPDIQNIADSVYMRLYFNNKWECSPRMIWLYSMCYRDDCSLTARDNII